MSIDDMGEYNRFQSEQHPRARKDHKCDACRETIRRGDRYHRTAIGTDYGVETWRHCLRCYAICKALWAAGAGTIDMELDCGHTWEENHKDGELRCACPDEVAALAFATADDMQARMDAK